MPKFAITIHSLICDALTRLQNVANNAQVIRGNRQYAFSHCGLPGFSAVLLHLQGMPKFLDTPCARARGRMCAR